MKPTPERTPHPSSLELGFFAIVPVAITSLNDFAATGTARPHNLQIRPAHDTSHAPHRRILFSLAMLRSKRIASHL